MSNIVVPLFWKSDSTHPVYLRGTKEFGRFRFDQLDLDGESYRLEPTVEIIESDTFLVSHGGDVWKFQQVADNSLVIGTSFLVAEVGAFLSLGINAEASVSARLILRIPPLGTTPQAFGTLDVCAHVDVDGGGINFCPDPICLSINLPKLPLAPDELGSPELWVKLPDLGVPVPRMPVPWFFPTVPLPVRWSAYSANLRGIDIRVGWESLLLDVTTNGLKLIFERFQIDGIAGNLEADIVIAISSGGIDLGRSSIKLRRGPSIPLEQWHVGDGCFSLKWKGRQFGELLSLIAPGIGADPLPEDAEIAIRVLTLDGAVSEIRVDVVPEAASTLPIEFPGFNVSLPGGKHFSLVYLASNGSGSAPPRDSVFATMSLAGGQQVIAQSTFGWTRFDDRELQNEGSGELRDEGPLIKVTATKTGDGTISLLELPIGDRPRFLRQFDDLLPPIWTGSAPQCDPTPFDTVSFDPDEWSIDFDFNDQLLDKFKFPFLNGETNGIGQYIKIKEPKFQPPDLSTSTVGGKVTVEIAVGPIRLKGDIGLNFNWETFAFDVDHGEGLDFVIAEDHEFAFLGLHWTFKERPGPFFKLVTANSDYKLIQTESSEIELRFTRATTEDQPIVFTVSNFEITEAGISLKAEVTEQPAKLNGLETEFRFKEGTFEIKENRILGFSIAGGGPLPPDLVGEANADIRLQFEQVGDSLELVSGSAKVAGNKLAHCKGTRFEFSLDALGLEFVNDGAYHLYFLVTASAEYKALDGDSSTGLLSYMPGIKIKLVDCPLTGNARVIAQYIEFKLKLPEPVSINLFGCFAMEIRGFGFLPQCDKFGGDGAIIISGQVSFASGVGDVVSADFDFHDMYVGLPEKGSLLPRFYMKGLGVSVKVGSSKVYGSVELIQDEEVAPRLIGNGFKGEGGIEISGLPPMAATFAFLRVIRPQDGREVRAWFVYLEARKMSFKIPIVEVYLREVGLGLGYRYTLVGIKRADEVDDVKQLIKELKVISRTQANLADHGSWTVDIEDPGQKPKVTVALRALISQTSAAKGPFEWNKEKEQKLACLFLLDAVIALRSDLTFFMVARGWLNTNYNDFVNSVENKKTLHKSPLVSGFVLLSPRQKRFLAHVASNPGAEFGGHPPVLDFLKRAIENSRFSATLLIEPGLVHAELGWPNMLQWGDTLGPLKVEFRGGAIFRTSPDELVSGLSYLAKGSVSFSAGVNLGFIGASLSATANVAYGARYIGVLDFRNISRSAFYGGIGVEIQVRARVEVWFKVKTFLGTLTESCRFDFDIHFTAALELGLLGGGAIGVRGSGTFCLKSKWKNLHITVHFSANDNAVNTARRITERFLSMGLEATEVDALPDVTQQVALQGALAPAGSSPVMSTVAPAGTASTQSQQTPDAPSVGVESLATGVEVQQEVQQNVLAATSAVARGPIDLSSLSALPEEFVSPEYFIMQKVSAGTSYFTLVPSGDASEVEVDVDDPRHGMVREGFYAVPPETIDSNNDGLPDNFVTSDYVWELPELNAETVIQRFDPTTDDWVVLEPDGGQISWKMGWEETLEEQATVLDEPSTPQDREAIEPSDPLEMKVKQVLRTAYFYDDPPEPAPGDPPQSPSELVELIKPLRDPVQWPDFNPDNSREDDLEDERQENPSDVSFEPVVRAAQEQFESAPYFRHDPKRSRYEEMLEQALDSRNDLYSIKPPVVAGDPKHTFNEEEATPSKEQQAIQIRSMLLQQVVTDLRTSVPKVESARRARQVVEPVFSDTIAGKLGMVFRAVTNWSDPQVVPITRETVDDAVSEDNAAALGEIKVVIGNIDPVFAESQTNDFFKIFQMNSGNSWIVSAEHSMFRLTEEEDEILLSTPSTSSIEDALQESDTWGTIWQRKAVDQRTPDVTVDGMPVELYNDAAKSFAVNSARPAEVRTYEHESTIAIGWKLNWRQAGASPEDYLAYYSVTRRRIDDANSEVQYRVQNVDPLVREAVESEGENPAYKVRRIRSRFQIVDHFSTDATNPLTREIQYVYSVTPIAMDGTAGVTETIVATRRPSTPPPVPTDARLEVLFPVEHEQFQPRRQPFVHQPRRLLIRWTEPVVRAGEPRISISKLRLVLRRNRTVPTGSYGIDADARGNVHTGVSATNSRKQRTDVTFEWDTAVSTGDTVKIGKEDGRAVYYLPIDIDSDDELVNKLRQIRFLPQEEQLWRPEAWDIFIQAEAPNGVRSSLAAVQVVLQFAPDDKVTDFVQKGLIGENEPRVESREVAQLEWFARPVAMSPLPCNDGDQERGWAIVPQPMLANGVYGKFDTGDLEFGYRAHPKRVRAIRFRINQGPSGQNNVPLDLHAGFQIKSFDALAHDPSRLEPNPKGATWDSFTKQARLKTLQEIELVPDEVLAMSPTDTFTPRIWEAWYPSEQRRRALSKENAATVLTGGQTKLSPWHSWRESRLIWPDPMTVSGDNVDPNALFRKKEKDEPLLWERGRHALLDEILMRVQYRVADLSVESENEEKNLLSKLNINDASELGDENELNDLNEVLTRSGESAVPSGSFVTVTEPGSRWRVLKPNGTSIRLERIEQAHAAGQPPTYAWRLLVPIDPRIPNLEIISQPWDVSNDLSTALNSGEPGSDPYGWNVLQRLGLSVTFALRMPDRGTVLPANELLPRIKQAVEQACDQPPFNGSFKKHVNVDLLYRFDRRMKIGKNESDTGDSSPEDLLSIVQVSLRPTIEKELQYDVWTAIPNGENVDTIRGKSIDLLIERTADPSNPDSPCHLVLQPGVPGAQIPVPSGEGDNAARVSVTIPAEGPLRLLFRGTTAVMPRDVKAANSTLKLDVNKSSENLPPWHPVSTHFNWTQETKWFEAATRFPDYIEAMGATFEEDAEDSFRFGGDVPDNEVGQEIQDWALRFFDYGGDVSGDGSGTITDTAWFATAYPRTYSPALVSPDEESKVIYDHFVDDQWASAYRNMVVPAGRYDRLWEFIAGSSVLFKETVARNRNLKTLDKLPLLPDGGLDVSFPRIQPVTSPIVQLSTRLDAPSTPGRPAPPGTVWEVVLERHPEQVLKEGNHHLAARLEFHDIVWTRFRRFRFSKQLLALQDVFFQRHLSWTVEGLDQPFFTATGDPATGRFTLEIDGNVLISDQPVNVVENQISEIRDLIEAAIPPADRDVIQVRAVTASDGKWLLMFIAQQDRTIRLKDEQDATRELTELENDLRHLISVNHVENQLDDSVGLPRMPREPDSSDSTAMDWVEKHGSIPIKALDSDTRRMIDLPLRQNRSRGGATIYQFDGLPYFYSQRLFFAARAGTEHSRLTRLDHSDFHYKSPIPETNAEGRETADGARLRQIEITLSRFWDCLSSEAKTRWTSESPHPAVTAMVGATTGVWVGTQFGAIYSYDLSTQALGDAIQGHSGRVMQLIFKESPARLFSLGYDRSLQRRNLAVDPVELTQVDFNIQVSSIASQTDVIAVGDSSGILHVLNDVDLSETGQRRVSNREITAVLGLANGDWLTGNVYGKIIRVLADLTSQVDWDDEHSATVTAFAMTGDGSKVCSVGNDGKLIVWDTSAGTAQRQYEHVDATETPIPLTAVAISDDDTTVAFADISGNIHSFGIDDISISKPAQISTHTTGLSNVVFHPNAEGFVSAGQNGSIQKGELELVGLDAGTFSTLPDTEVIYQYVLVKPGRVIETISEIRFDSLQAHGYSARDIAVGYKTEVNALTPPSNGDARMRLSTSLESESNASVTIAFESDASKASLTFEAKSAGASGFRVAIEFTKEPLGDAAAPDIAVQDTTVTVTLNSTAGSESTVGDVVTAFNGNLDASELVLASLVGDAEQDATYRPTPWKLPLGEKTTQWISSRSSFDESKVPAGTSFGVPHACRLRWSGALSVEKEDAKKVTEQIDELIAYGVDASFREALLLLQRQLPDCVEQTVFPVDGVNDLFKKGRINLGLVSYLAGLGVILKLRSWMEPIDDNKSVWLAHSGNRTHRIEIDNSDTDSINFNIYQTLRDNVAEASVGLEQLAELPAFKGVRQKNPTPKYRTEDPREDWMLTWVGAMSQDQYEVLKRDENGATKGWTVTSDFRDTFSSMLQALLDRSIVIGFDGPHPDAGEIPAIISSRFEISDTGGGATEHQLTWTGLVLHRVSSDSMAGTDVVVLEALDAIHALASGEQGFKDAVDALRQKLIGDEGARENVAVPIDDSQWFPRPTQDDLHEHFPELSKHLMIRSGMLSFSGIMTQAEAMSLFEDAAYKADVDDEARLKTSPDQRACEELFADAFNTGLDGARIEVRARRRSAPMVSREVEAIIQRKSSRS